MIESKKLINKINNYKLKNNFQKVIKEKLKKEGLFKV